MNDKIKKIPVKTKNSTYDVIVGRGLLKNVAELICNPINDSQSKIAKPDRIFIVSDSNVFPLYGDIVCNSFKRAGYETSCFVFEAGEIQKNPQTLTECLEKMALSELSRDSLLVTLGGGVACDLGGFAAATYMRGIKVLQIPTSLLAMVDASVGGKTAVDLKAGKNLFGAFHQPVAVIADVNTLHTLSDFQFQDAIGEIVKHSILADGEMFDYLSTTRLTKDMIDSQQFLELVARNVEIKRDIVESDEHEKNIRQTLNLGHTFGHAIEADSEFKLGHGTCVAIGLKLVAELGNKLGITSDIIYEKIKCALQIQGLDCEINCSAGDIYRLIANDKKRHSDYVNMVFVEEIGKCIIKPINLDDLQKFLPLIID